MLPYKCDNCNNTHSLNHLTTDRETGDYLCPDCYRKNEAMKKDAEISSTIVIMVGIIIIALLFGWVFE